MNILTSLVMCSRRTLGIMANNHLFHANAKKESFVTLKFILTVLYGCETWSLNLKEWRKLQIFAEK